MPAATGQDRPNGAFFDTVRIGQLPLRFSRAGMAFANLVRDLFVQFRVRPSLNVDTVGNGIEMFGVHAPWLTTQMVDIPPVGDRSVCADVRLTVSETTAAYPVSVGEDPVSVMIVRMKEYVTGSLVPTVIFNPEVWPPLHSLCDSTAMTNEESEGLSLDPTMVSVVARHEKRELAAAALAKFSRFFPFHHRITLSGALT